MADPQDLTEWKPSKPGFSLLSKGLAGIGNFMAAPFGYNNPPGAILADLIGIKPAASLLDKVAYGDPLTQGSGQTFSTAPDVFDGAMALAPPVAGLLKGMGKVSSKIPLARDSAPAALYSGMGKKTPADPSLFLSHGTNVDKLLTPSYAKNANQLPAELYHLSQAITRDRLSQFSGADTWLIPQYGRFEPKLDQTVITATDSYSPRYGAAMGSRVDSLREALGKGYGSMDRSGRKAEANNRLADQFGFPFDRGGLYQEGEGKRKFSGGFARLKNFGEGTLFPFKGRDSIPNINTADAFQNRVSMSPHFQSLESFQNSPYGGKILGDKNGYSNLSSAETTGRGMLENLRFYDPNNDFLTTLTDQGAWPEVMRQFASGFADPLTRSGKGRKFDNLERAPFAFENLRVRNPGAEAWSSNLTDYRSLTPDEISQLRQTSGKVLQQIKTAPSDYAEVKRYGATKLNPDTFAGIITKDGDGRSRLLEKQALARGLAFERLPYGSSNADATEAATAMQKAGKNPSVLVRGLAGLRDTPANSGTNYADLTASVKQAANDLKADPTNPKYQAAYKEAADAWMLDSDLFVQNGDITNAEHGAMHDYLNKQINNFQSAPKSPQAGGPFASDFLNNLATTENLAAGQFDYLPDSEVEQLLGYAAKTGNAPLKNTVQAYKDHSLTMGIDAADNATHDSLLKQVLQEVQAIKSGWQPAQAEGWGKTPLPAQKKFSMNSFAGKSLAELKAMDVSGISKEGLGLYDQALAAASAGPKNFNDKYAETVLKHYSGSEHPGYFGLGQIEAAHPELNTDQLDALANYSWAHSKASAPHEKDAAALWDKFLATLSK